MASARRRFLLSLAGFGGAVLGRRAAGWSAAGASAASPGTTHLPSSPGHEPPMASAQPQATAPQRADARLPTREEAESWYARRRNWGRWGRDDQMGAVNL